MSLKLLWSLLLLGGLSALLPGQATVSVHPGSVLHELSGSPLGLNLNTLTDGGDNWPGARDLSRAVGETGVRYLRFPGGEKSDVYAWAAPPYDDPSTAYLLRRGENDWPSNDPAIWNLAGNTWANDNYDFDEFIADCRATGAEPVVVVAFDGMYLPANPGGTSLTREQALELAVEWVRYANVTKGYNVKYWELGNETWNGTTYAGKNPGFATYGRDAAEFARAMKAVDPSILIGINGRSFSDFDLALKECADAVDYLDVHAYPAYGFGEYRDYRDGQLDPLGIVNVAQSAIDAVADPAARDNLFIVMTETSATGFRLSSAWDDGNNLGQALANFDILAQTLEDDRLRFTLYWNSHWIRPDKGRSHPYDLFTGTNQLNASGEMLALMNREILDEMVETTSDGVVRTFATASRERDRLTVFLLNKDTVATATDLRVENFPAAATVARSVFTGDHPGTTDVTLTTQTEQLFRDGRVALQLPPASLTVLRFGTASAPTDYWLEAECAAVGGSWTTSESGSASGGSYVVATASSSMNIVPADLADNRVRFNLSVASPGSYQLFARINAPSNTQDSYWVRVNEGAWYKWNSRILQNQGFRWNPFPAAVNLRTGENTIDFAFRESGTQLDKLYLTPDGTLPSGTGAAAGNCGNQDTSVNLDPTPPTGAVEAECAVAGPAWQRQSSDAASDGAYRVFTGERHLAEPTNDTEELRFTVEAAKAGSYQLFLRVDAPDPSRNSVWVRVDDQPWMKFWRETNGDQLLTSGLEWRKVNHDGVARAIELGAGSHTIRVANREPGTKIDKLLLTPVDAPPDGFGPEAEDCAVAAPGALKSGIHSTSPAVPSPAGNSIVGLYPNPAVNELALELSSHYTGPVRVIIYDLHGRRLHERVFNKQEERLNARLTVRSLASGLYRLRVIEGGDSVTTSFLRR